MATTYQPFGKPTNSDYGKPRGAGKTHWGQDELADLFNDRTKKRAMPKVKTQPDCIRSAA
jgi:hypothetical protein